MRLHPDAAAILERVREAGVPPWASMPPVEGREVYRGRARLFAGSPLDGRRRLGHHDPVGRGPLGISVYRPDGGRPRPIFLYLHGGGWTLGDLDSHDARLPADLASRPTASWCHWTIGSRPSIPTRPRWTTRSRPITWLADHGADLGGDPTRLAIGGDSAGGNLTAGAVIRLRDEGGPRVALQVLIYPATQPSFEMLSFYENAEGYCLLTGDVIWFWENYLGGSETAGRQYACPGAATDLRDLPPAVVITGDFDPVRDDGDIYAIKLRAAGVPVVGAALPGDDPRVRGAARGDPRRPSRHRDDRQGDAARMVRRGLDVTKP